MLNKSPLQYPHTEAILMLCWFSMNPLVIQDFLSQGVVVTNKMENQKLHIKRRALYLHVALLARRAMGVASARHRGRGTGAREGRGRRRRCPKSRKTSGSSAQSSPRRNGFWFESSPQSVNCGRLPSWELLSRLEIPISKQSYNLPSSSLNWFCVFT